MVRRPRTSSAKATKAAPRGQIPKLSDEAKGLLNAANGSSDAARNAWLAFLALVTYLLVTLGGVSHEDLLLNSGVKLPIVNIEIPLFSFFQYAPLLLLLVLLSLLIQHVVLARKYRKFVEAISPYETKARKEHKARELVHSYVVAQLLAGPKHDFVTSWLMRLMVFVTFALLPLVTLLYFQIKFIPYHEVWVTYWHRIAVLLALVILFAPLWSMLWSMQFDARKREIKVGPQGEAWRVSPFGVARGALTGTLVMGFSWLIATIPDERLDRLIGFVPANVAPTDVETLLNPLVRVAYERLPHADNPEARGWLLRWLVSYRVLVVEDQDLVPDKDDKHNEVSVELRGRDFRFARLSRSDLHRADLTKADLRRAAMEETRLEKAKLEEAKLQGANLGSANLQGADLRGAQLQGADLGYAKLQGADLGYAKLQGADLTGAQLPVANLGSANLQDADLRGAQLQGADLSEAQLQGANLGGVNVWLASFPRGPGNQSPAPLLVARLDLSPLTAEAKAELRAYLKDDITDGKLLDKVTDSLDPILRDDPPKWEDWEDEARWSRYVSQATEPPPDQLVRFLAEMACGDRGGYIAISMAQRAVHDSEDQYAKPLARALLNETCEGAKALSDETRAELRERVSAAE